MTVYGYGRVSSQSQDLELQRAALAGAGCEKVFAEKISATKSLHRPQLDRLLRQLGPGDVVVCQRLDRAARSTKDLLQILDTIRAKGAGFRVLDNPMLDTTTPHGQMLAVILSAIAAFESSLTLARTRSGIEAARARGVKFGRKAKLNENQKLILARRYAGGETMRELASEFRVSVGTVHAAINGGP